jgi:7-cyano-7-deazaguanine synthase in queuosine biosynthesis
LLRALIESAAKVCRVLAAVNHKFLQMAPSITATLPKQRSIALRHIHDVQLYPQCAMQYVKQKAATTIAFVLVVAAYESALLIIKSKRWVKNAAKAVGYNYWQYQQKLKIIYTTSEKCGHLKL